MNSQDGPNKSFTFASKWSYVPGKVFNLTPLNIEDIRKQLLENSEETEDAESDDTEESADTVNECDDEVFKTKSTGDSDQLNRDRNSLGNNKEVIIVTSPGVIEEIHKEPEHKIKFFDYNSSRRLSSLHSSLESVAEDTLRYVELEDPYRDICMNKENISDNIEPMNLSKEKPRTEDSFDLDLSALTLQTPIKKKEKNFNYVTPKINIIPPSETKSLSKPGPRFKTPNVSKNPFALKKLFKTPINKPLIAPQYSAKRQHGTPYQSLVKTKSNQHSRVPEICDNHRVPMPPSINPNECKLDRIDINNTEYIVMNMLGRGGSSEVFHAFNPEEKVHVAIKIVSLTDPMTAEGYINEVKLLESLQSCDRIIKMYDYEIRDEKLMVVLENGGDDLSTILKQIASRQTHLPIYMLIFYWMEMLNAVRQIHSNGVIHSDLKPANFIRAEGGLKLIDFGIASKVQEDMTCVYKSNQEGSCNYISPEALNVQTNGNVNSPSYGTPKYKVHFKSDVWSLGCILYQLVYRKTPFQHLNPIWAKLAAIIDPKHKIEYAPVDWIPSRVLNTIKRCLQHDVRSRPSVDELLQEYEQLLQNL